MAIRPNLSSGWVTYEVIQKNADGDHEFTPFSSALAIGGATSAQAVNKMRMVQDLGWPEASYQLKDGLGRALIVKKDELIWLLKCKPTCWRLYFYVRQGANDNQEGRIIYVHAICKKKNRENASDAIAARRIADNIRPGGSGIRLFEFPFV
jgi:hypothetical protein